MRILEGVLVVVLLGLFILIAYVLWDNMPRGPSVFETYAANVSPSLPGQSKQFYPNMRFVDNDISYSLEEACSKIRREDIKKALGILEENTVLRFYELEEGAEIHFYCSQLPPNSENKNHFIAGEGGPTEIINTTRFAVILSAQVSLYRPEQCEEPKIALHEILHALGFDHNRDKTSIMFEFTDCNQKLDSYIVDDLNQMYSIPSKADLSIEKIDAEISSRSVDFKVVALNGGLKNVRNATLEVWADNELIREFEVGEVKIGTRKFLNVENLRIPGSSKRIVFVVSSYPVIEELTNDNNQVEFSKASS